MTICKPKIGKNYLTISGLPVRVTGLNSDIIILQSLDSVNRFTVPLNYPLGSIDDQKLQLLNKSWPDEVKSSNGQEQNHQPEPLAPIIDALLLAGGKSMRGLVREIKRKASSACKGKDVWANVRARIYWLRKKGFRAEKNERDQIQIVPV